MYPSDTHAWLARDVLVHERALRAYVSRFFPQQSDIQDIVQDTYARLLKLTPAERGAVTQWQAFVFATARNVALDRLRKQRIVSITTVAEMERLDVFDERTTPFEELNTRQELAMLSEAIAALPDRCRQVITLAKLYGLSHRDIALKLGIAESTVEKHVANGVRLCAERLSGLRGTESGDVGAAESAPGTYRTRIKRGRDE